MRIDSKSAIGDYPALKICELLRRLNNLLYWNAETVQAMLRTEPTEVGTVISALIAAGHAVAERSRQQIAGPPLSLLNRLPPRRRRNRSPVKLQTRVVGISCSS
jgi:hypothetical protein